MKYKRQIKFEPGFDCTKYECKFSSEKCAPGKSGSHGVHGMNMRFVVSGPDGAVQFLLYTGWLPIHDIFQKNPMNPLPADLGYHSKKPMYDDHDVMGHNCEFTDGVCYYGGSGLNAEDAFKVLTSEGDGQLWKFLEAYYDCIFLDKEYPDCNDFILTNRIERTK